MKIHRVGAEAFHSDGQTDITKLIVAFRNFTNAPKKKKEETGCICFARASIVLYYNLPAVA